MKQKNAALKQKNLQILAILLIILLIAVLALMISGFIGPLAFWAIVIVVGIFAFFIMPKIAKKIG